jgi:hypothetical protein
MAATFDAASYSAELSGQSSRTWAHTVGDGSNRALFVGVMVRDMSSTAGLGSAISVTYDDEELTLVGTSAPTNSDIGYVTAQIWRILNPPVGEHDIVVEWGDNIARGGCGAVSFFDVDQETPTGSPVTSYGNFDTNATLLITPPVDDCVILDTVYDMTSSFAPSETGQTARVNIVFGQGSFEDSGGMSTRGPIDPAAETAMSWTHPDNGYWAQIACAIRPASEEETIDAEFTVQAQSATSSINTRVDITGTSSVQAQSATGTIAALVNVSFQLTSQAQNATHTGDVGIDIDTAFTGQAQSATTTGLVGIDVTGEFDGQSAGASFSGNLFTEDTIYAEFNVQAQPATGKFYAEYGAAPRLPVYQVVTQGRKDGTQIGVAPTDKVGFFGAVPVVQQSVSMLTSTSTTETTSVAVAVNQIIDALCAYGLVE